MMFPTVITQAQGDNSVIMVDQFLAKPLTDIAIA
jgi:hypothetical protein